MEGDFYYHILQYAPMEYRIAKVCLAAVKRDGRALQFVPDELKTAEVCIKAMAGGGKVFWHIPETQQTGELDLESVKGKNLLLKNFLEESLGGQKARDLMSRILSKLWGLPNEYGSRMNPPPIVDFVRQEQAQTIFDPKTALDILRNLPCDTQVDVVRRVATMNISTTKVFPCLIRWILDTHILRKKAETLSSINIAKILDLAELTSGKEIFETLKGKDPELAKKLYSRIFLFAFDDVRLLSDRDIQMIIQEIDRPVLAKALKGAETSVQDWIFDNMSTQATRERMGRLGWKMPTKPNRISSRLSSI